MTSGLSLLKTAPHSVETPPAATALSTPSTTTRARRVVSFLFLPEGIPQLLSTSTSHRGGLTRMVPHAADQANPLGDRRARAARNYGRSTQPGKRHLRERLSAAPDLAVAIQFDATDLPWPMPFSSSDRPRSRSGRSSSSASSRRLRTLDGISTRAPKADKLLEQANPDGTIARRCG